MFYCVRQQGSTARDRKYFGIMPSFIMYLLITICICIPWATELIIDIFFNVKTVAKQSKITKLKNFSSDRTTVINEALIFQKWLNNFHSRSLHSLTIIFLASINQHEACMNIIILNNHWIWRSEKDAIRQIYIYIY